MDTLWKRPSSLVLRIRTDAHHFALYFSYEGPRRGIHACKGVAAGAQAPVASMRTNVGLRLLWSRAASAGRERDLSCLRSPSTVKPLRRGTCTEQRKSAQRLMTRCRTVPLSVRPTQRPTPGAPARNFFRVVLARKIRCAQGVNNRSGELRKHDFRSSGTSTTGGTIGGAFEPYRLKGDLYLSVCVCAVCFFITPTSPPSLSAPCSKVRVCVWVCAIFYLASKIRVYVYCFFVCVSVVFLFVFFVCLSIFVMVVVMVNHNLPPP